MWLDVVSPVCDYDKDSIKPIMFETDFSLSPAEEQSINCQSICWHNGNTQLVVLPKLVTSACCPSALTEISLSLFSGS